MCGIDGIEVLNIAKKQQPAPAVIVLTGYGSLDTAIAAIRHGAYDYLLKPCPPNELLRRVEGAVERRSTELRQAHAVQTIAMGLAQLQGQEHAASMPPHAHTSNGNTSEPAAASPPPSPVIRVGQLSIDSLSHEASFDGQPLRLTPTEFALLHCLAEVPGRVLSYGDIVTHTHGHSVDDSEAQLLLKAHVRNLRRKIAPSYLVNVRGTGYRLATPEELKQMQERDTDDESDDEA
jgi:two-component system response regulator QseB